MRFLFDVHVHLSACHQLQRKGVDVVHAGEVGLGDAADHELLAFAIREDRIVVTRNYHDFARLAEAFAGQGGPFPASSFFPPHWLPPTPAATFGPSSAGFSKPRRTRIQSPIPMPGLAEPCRETHRGEGRWPSHLV
ncbi:MAG: DUF5615 family PIN-like protein [Acidobacteriota bacterium]